jgi:hypothetical protein
MKLKNIILGLGLTVLGLFAQAQNGLENILVERYYTANAIDAAASAGTLPAGSVTYRIYADMLPGYKFSTVYGNSLLGVPSHTLKLQSTTSFFNNEDRGAKVPTYTKTQAAANTVMLDSWLSVGSACAGQFGVPLWEDNGVSTVVHTGGVLAALSANDGFLPGTADDVTFVGTAAPAANIFDAISQAGNDFSISEGAWSSLVSQLGPIAATNRVLIGQFTTDGDFHFELNIQIIRPAALGGLTEKYVVSNAVDASENVKSFMTQTLLPVVQTPVVTLDPALNNSNYSIGAIIPLTTATASVSGPSDGIDFVEFFVDGVSVGIDFTSPYAASYTGVNGSHIVKALAHSKQGVSVFSTPATVNVGNQAPVVAVNPIGVSLEVGKSFNLDAVATDDALVASVEFFVGGASIGMGTHIASPANTWRIAYTPTATGSISITAKATDADATPKSTTSAAVTATVVSNAGPVVNITQPLTNTTSAYGTAITLSATATDVDGVSSVEFFDGTTSLGMGAGTGPYTLTLPATLALGSHSFTALAKDNATPKAQSTSTAVVVVINNPLPSVTSVSGTPNPVLQGAVVVLSATATDDRSGVSVQFFNGATLLGSGVKQGATDVFTLSYTPSFFGSISLIAKATDDLGQVTTSATVPVTVTPAGAYELVSTSQVCNIESVCMPIKSLQAVDNINGYNFTIKYDKAKVVPTGNITVSNDLISTAILAGHNAEYVTDYNTSISDSAGAFSYLNIGIYFNSSVPTGLMAQFAGAAGKQVCCVEFTKKPAFASVDNTTLVFAEVIESYVAADAAFKPANVSGIFSTFKDYTLSGSLKFWSDMSPIQYATGVTPGYLITNITGNTHPATVVNPDINGNFTYNIQNGVRINILRDIANTAAVTPIHTIINSQDAYLTALTSIDGTSKINWIPGNYQMIAMDVNRDKLITAGDATQINQRAVKLIDEFNQNGKANRDWLFVSNTEVTSNLNYLVSTKWPQDDHSGYSRYKVPSVDILQDAMKYSSAADTACPLINDEKYIGVMLGDIDATYASVAHDGVVKSAETASGSEIIFDLNQAVIENGNIVIPVTLNSSEAVHNFDFDVKLNDLKVAVKSVDGFGQGMNLSWNYITDEKTLSVAAFNPLYNISTDYSAALTMTVSGTEALTAADFNATLALINGAKASLKVIESTLGLAGNTKENMISIYPNPSSDVLNVTVASKAKVQILDLNGKSIGAVKNVNANEKQVIDVKNLAAGVYMVKIYNDKFVKTQRVVISK